MVKFLTTFLCCIAAVWAFLFFGGIMVFESLFAIIVFAGLILAVLIRVFAELLEGIEDIKKRCESLEEKLSLLENEKEKDE